MHCEPGATGRCDLRTTNNFPVIDRSYKRQRRTVPDGTLNPNHLPAGVPYAAPPLIRSVMANDLPSRC